MSTDRKRKPETTRYEPPLRRVRVLDPTTATVVDGAPPPRPTAYIGDHLLVNRTGGDRELVQQLSAVAEEFGWRLAERKEQQRLVVRRLGDDEAPIGAHVLELSPLPGRAVRPPDAWDLLQAARAQHGRDGMRSVGLDHVLTLAAVGSDPFHSGDPFH